MSENIQYATEEQIANRDSAPADDVVDTVKFLIFMCDDLKLGVYARHVVEILTNQTITYLPMVPDFIRGIINMRGEMLPIVDIRTRLGKPYKDNALVIVLNIADTQLGILVDNVDQMIDIPKSHILPMPAHSDQVLVSGMSSLPDGAGTMMVLDCEQLLPND